MTRSRSFAVAVVLAFSCASVVAQEARRPSPAAALLDRVSKWARPEYPAAALAAKVTGSVDVDVAVDENGGVEVRDVSGPDELRYAAEQAVAAWQFRPAEGDEPRVPVAATLTFDFVDEDGVWYATLRRTTDTIGKKMLPVPEGGSGANVTVVAAPYAVLPKVGAPSAPGSPAASKAHILNRPRPNYTEQARWNHADGNVTVKVLLRADGTVGSVQVVRGLPDGLSLKAVEAARQLEFDPARDADGGPLDTWMTVSVNFTIR
jgi:TonB family protein